MTNSKVVHDLALLWRKPQVFVHFIVKEGTDTCRSKAKSLGGKIHSLTLSASLEVDVSIATIPVAASRIFKIANH